MQRVSDLIWISRGLVKIGQTCAQNTCNEIGFALRASSVTGPLMEQCEKATGVCDVSEFDETFDKNIFDEEEVFSELVGATEVNATTTTSEPPSGKGPARQYHTSAHPFLRHNFVLHKTNPRTWNKNCLLSPHNRHLHTSNSLRAFTADELAAIAKVHRVRNVEKKTKKLDSKMDNITSESKERRVPTSRLGRLASFGGLAASMAFGSLSDAAKKSVGISEQESNQSSLAASVVLTEANMEKIVATLCKVRGAALKLGQMLSIQDVSVVDPKLVEVFDRVRQSADYMPASQMKKVLVEEFGSDWRNLVKEFDEKPFAAASIGQVHRAVLHNGKEVAMKIQYPGVADSINSDIDNLVSLLKLWNIFPEQLYIDKFIDVSRRELAWECDYQREAEFMKMFREVLAGEEMYGVPEITPQLSGKRVLTTELITGVPIDQVGNLSQDERNYVAAAVLRLVLREIFELRCMQTDPNWANFFYNEDQQKLWLLDFGASRSYSKQFVDEYIDVVKGAADGDRELVLEKSKKLGFLTGYEPQVMNDAHVDAIMILGEPFASDDVFDFSTQNTSSRIMNIVPVFMKHRLSPPPEETYSLHRKLSGAFLIATKLKAKFACQKMFFDIYEKYWQENVKTS
ncbi:atypical kinase COQ8B, mitochondrial [Ciona intestinalis]